MEGAVVAPGDLVEFRSDCRRNPGDESGVPHRGLRTQGIGAEPEGEAGDAGTGCPGRRERTLRVPGGRSRSRNEDGLRAPADAGGVPEVAVRSAGGVRPGVRGSDDPASPREGRGGSGVAATTGPRRPAGGDRIRRLRRIAHDPVAVPRRGDRKADRGGAAALRLLRSSTLRPLDVRPGRVAPRRQSPAHGAEVSGVGGDLSSNSTTRNCREGATARRPPGRAVVTGPTRQPRAVP